MNISASSLLEARQRDGEAADERPTHVEEALTPDKRVGWRDGLPLVEPEGGIDEETRLGDDLGHLYQHYRRGESLLLPDAGTFIRRLFEADQVTSVEDAAAEVRSDISTVRKAAGLHGVDLPTDDGDDDADDTEEIEQLQLPSGEEVPTALLDGDAAEDKLVLASLLSAGMSVEEIARYLSKELDYHITAAEVREAAQEANLLKGGVDSETDLAHPDEVSRPSGDPVKTPW